MKDSKIAWTHHTFNPWIGCQRVSPGCEHCYAEAQDERWRPGKTRWGPKAERTRTSPSYWKQPIAWNRAAENAGDRHRVFCASLADVFEDRPELAPWRRELFDVIDRTPSLDWLLLTKRPENIDRLWPDGLPPPSVRGWPNVWLGTTVEDQRRAEERIPELIKVPAAVRFLSCEPLLGPLDLDQWMDEDRLGFVNSEIDWVIIGGESGHYAREFRVEWARDLIWQCRNGGRSVEPVPFVKQLGAAPTVNFYDDEFEAWFGWKGIERPDPIGWCERDGQPPIGSRMNVRGLDRAGADPGEWPPGLRVREFPEPRR